MQIVLVKCAWNSSEQCHGSSCESKFTCSSHEIVHVALMYELVLSNSHVKLFTLISVEFILGPMLTVYVCFVKRSSVCTSSKRCLSFLIHKLKKKCINVGMILILKLRSLKILFKATREYKSCQHIRIVCYCRTNERFRKLKTKFIPPCFAERNAHIKSGI